MTVTINGTTGIAGTNGSAGTPAVQGEDTNTGIFFPAADTVAVATGGTERLRVDSSGNVGIGVTPSSQPLEIKRGAGTGALVEVAGNNNTPGSTSAVYGQDSAGNAFAWNRANLPLLLGTNNTERARIDSSGNLLVGTTTAIGRLTVDGNGPSNYGATFSNTTSGNNVLGVFGSASGGTQNFVVFSQSAGSVRGTISTNGTTTAYNTSSDYRLKENVHPMQDALAVIAQLNPVTYTWKADGSAGQGFIAHELQAVVPDCVTGEKDAVDAEGNPQYQGVDTSFLVATLVKAIQELTARIAILEAK
jgi:hypothetical protein